MLIHWLQSPTIRGLKSPLWVDHYATELREQIWKAFKESKVLSISEAERQKQYYDRKASTVSLEPGDLVLAHDAYRGRRKVKDQLEEESYEVECQFVKAIPSYLVRNWQTGCSQVLH